MQLSECTYGPFRHNAITAPLRSETHYFSMMCTQLDVRCNRVACERAFIVFPSLLSFRASRCHGSRHLAVPRMASSLPTRSNTGRLVAVETKRPSNPTTSGTCSQVRLRRFFLIFCLNLEAQIIYLKC